MSRRKQGRPQQRKTLDSVEQENDLLVCGDCQTSFPLHDIVHFIKHKKQCCDKENLDSNGCRKDAADGDRDDNDKAGDSSMEADNEDEEAPSSRIAKNDNDDEDDDDEIDEGGSPTVNGEREGDARKSDDKEKRRRREEAVSNRSREERRPLKQKQVVDAESNTTHSEPSRFECETCRSTYTSAWGLLQHAQKEHGMKIYTSPSSSSTSSSSTSSSGHSNAPVNSVLSNVSPIDLAMSSSARSAMDRRSASSTGSVGSVSPFPVHAPNPFSSPFRLPLDGRLPHPSAISPFSRAPAIDFDLINDTRLRPQFLGRGIPGLDHSNFAPSPFDRSRGHIPPGLESQYDYYSMRLKQLACSPVLSHSKSFLNPTQGQPMRTSSLTPTLTKTQSPPTAEASSTSSPRPSSLSSALALPQKLKSCEFCGKSFRFQSNLVVHRRSHTGEKPFKCHKCPHACTQQSKLKRHMKTHFTKSHNTEGATSPGGTPINVKEEEDVDDGEEEEEEEEDEMEGEEEEEDIVEEEMNDEEREVLESMRVAKRDENQVDSEPGEIRHDAKRIKREHSNDKLTEEDDCVPSDLSMKKQKQTESLLSEVMKHSGLNSIQTYSEAFKAALAESQENEKNRELDRVSVKSEEKNGDRHSRASTPRTPKPERESDKDLDKSGESEPIPFYGGTNMMAKAVKNNVSPAVWNAMESMAVNPIESAASMYSRLPHPWFHPDSPVRLFFQPGFPPGRLPHTARDLSLSRENHGLNLSPTTTASALSSTSPNLPAMFKACTNSRGSSSAGNSPTTSLLLPSNGNSNLITPLKKEHRRNDTCEYCGKIFKNCSNLTVHRRSHTGEKPYKCSLCNYACAQSSKLTRHMKTHGRVGKDVYPCKFCNMPFSVPSTLEKHMRKCVENRQGRILADGAADLSSEASNGDIQDSFAQQQPHLSPHLSA